jgi:hypothetical protein
MPAKMSAPLRAGTAVHFEATEFSHKGEGVDAVAKYRTPDQQILATLYIYYPSIAHAGVQALATDHAIQRKATPPVEALGTGVAAAAGQQGVAVTADYTHYLGNLSSKSAFIKAGRWMVKIRVSGPEPRAAEVNAIMAALLNELRFEGEAQPLPAAQIAPANCAESDRRDARLLPDDGKTGLAGALLGAFDAAGETARNEPRGRKSPLLPRIGRNWCRSILDVGDAQLVLLQSTDPESGGDGLGGKSLLLLLYSDAGGMFEVVRLSEERKYLLLDHKIAEMKVLGTYDALPSAAQLRQLFDSAGEQKRVRARVRLKANGDSSIEIVVPDEEKKRLIAFRHPGVDPGSMNTAVGEPPRAVSRDSGFRRNDGESRIASSLWASSKLPRRRPFT